MASVLEKAFNATVRGVATNDEAIQELETQRFELIVTDLSHPGGNGLELLAGLHSERMRGGGESQSLCNRRK